MQVDFASRDVVGIEHDGITSTALSWSNHVLVAAALSRVVELDDVRITFPLDNIADRAFDELLEAAHATHVFLQSRQVRLLPVLALTLGRDDAFHA